jgi:hypothetical protein
MTTDRDFDVIARAWLDLLPDEAPDRTVAAVLQAVETTPQVRRPIRWLFWRSTTMNRLPIALGAAAVVVVASTLVLSRAGAPPSVGASASPITTIAPSASASFPSSSSGSAGEPVAQELQGRWMGGHRPIVAADAGTTILFGANSIAISQANDGPSVLLTSGASTIGAGRFQLDSPLADGDCAAGASGTYGWTRTPSGRMLTITAEGDECPARSAAVAGQWWLMGCSNPDNFCLGALDAGTYQSQFITPRLDPGATWTANFGALSYQVPDGWANDSDWPDSFNLVPASEMPLSETSRTRHIGLNTQPTAMAQDQPCSDTVAPGVSRTVDALTTWLRTVPGLVTTTPKAITIDGHPGKWLDVRLDPAWTRNCAPDETRPVVAYFNPGIAVGNVERERLILLDLGGGDVIAIVVWTANQATFDTFIAEAMPIVQSFTFE